MKFARNNIKYMSVRHIWNLSRLLGLFTSCKLANLSWNFVTKTSKQCTKTCRHWGWCKKLGTSHDVKSFAIGSFLDGIVVEREQVIISVKKALVQSRSIFSEICPEIPTKLAVFDQLFVSKGYPQKFQQNQPIFLRICPWKSREMWLFS